MPLELQPNKSTRSFDEWKAALQGLVDRHSLHGAAELIDERIKQYYDQGLMPDVCFKELFNR